MVRRWKIYCVLGIRVYGLEIRALGLGIRVQGLGIEKCCITPFCSPRAF